MSELVFERSVVDLEGILPQCPLAGDIRVIVVPSNLWHQNVAHLVDMSPLQAWSRITLYIGFRAQSGDRPLFRYVPVVNGMRATGATFNTSRIRCERFQAVCVLNEVEEYCRVPAVSYCQLTPARRLCLD